MTVILTIYFVFITSFNKPKDEKKSIQLTTKQHTINATNNINHHNIIILYYEYVVMVNIVSSIYCMLLIILSIIMNIFVLFNCDYSELQSIFGQA